MTDPVEQLDTGPKLGPGEEFAGYRIERLLDRGGMGVVYMATEIDLERTVALKIIAPEHTRDETAVARFKSEARLAASLEHPNIVPIHRAGSHDGVLFLAMRFVPGTNLRRVIDRGPMDLLRIGRIVTQIAAALDAAHAKGLVHRDVKPANILVTGEGVNEHIFLTDFGLTKRLGSAGDLTRSGGWVGTPDYVAPEQIQGHHVDRRADVYSLGCVLYEMLTGHVAYPKDSDMAKLWAHVTDPPPLPRAERPELVDEFDKVVCKATAKDPDDRYSTAGEMAGAVRDALVLQEAKRRREADQPTGEGESIPVAPTIAESAMGGAAVGQAATAADADVPVPKPAPPAAEPAPEPVASVPPPAAAVPAVVAAAASPAPPAGAPPAPPAGAAPPAEPPVIGETGGGGGGGGGRRRVPLVAILGGLAAAAAAVVAVVLLTGGSSNKSANTTTTQTILPGDRVAAGLGPLPLSRVHGTGKVTMRLNGNVASVTLDTSGLLNGSVHLLHIHAGKLGKCPPASAARLHNGHRVISTVDGIPFYGPPALALTTHGGTSVPPKRNILALKRFPTQGNIRYTRTIRLAPVLAIEVRKDDAVIVVHGDDYNDNGIYDNSLERSDLKRSLPGELTTPALCGPLVLAKKPTVGNGTATGQVSRHGAVYVATLRPQVTADDSIWWCHLPAGLPEADSTA